MTIAAVYTSPRARTCPISRVRAGLRRTRCVARATQHSPDVFRPPYYEVQPLRMDEKEAIDWGVELIGVDDVWKQTRGEGIKVAVLDSGVVTRHPDLEDHILEAVDFTNSASGPEDKNGHGTHCAGIVAAKDNEIGVVGVAPKASLLCAKVLGDSGQGGFEGIVKGIDWAVEQKADIISMSLGGPRPHQPMEEAINRAIEAGVIVVAAAGNDGWGWFFDNIGYPGNYKDVICVGSIDRNSKRSSFSSTGLNIDIMAPGGKVRSCWIPPQYYSTISGTSMACPFISGVCALALAKNRKSGGDKIDQHAMFELLKSNAADVHDSGFDKMTGWGLVDVGFIEGLSHAQDASGSELEVLTA